MSVVPKLEATIMGDAGTADKLEAYTESWNSGSCVGLW